MPANFIYKDENFVVFHNIKPSAPVHVLMMPVKHIESVNELKENNVEDISRMILKSNEIAEELGIKDSGYKLVINVGSGAGQVIFHLHIHLMGGWTKS